MKLEVGMYVRTLTLSGFSRIGKLEKIDDICVTDNGAIDKTQIIKTSHNIIDLIEVGDYVNGYKVDFINKFEDNYYIKGEGTNGFEIDIEHQEQIKSLVTKEYFESMSYKVGE